MKLLQRVISELQIELRAEMKNAKESQYTKVDIIHFYCSLPGRPSDVLSNITTLAAACSGK